MGWGVAGRGQGQDQGGAGLFRWVWGWWTRAGADSGRCWCKDGRTASGWCAADALPFPRTPRPALLPFAGGRTCVRAGRGTPLAERRVRCSSCCPLCGGGTVQGMHSSHRGSPLHNSHRESPLHNSQRESPLQLGHHNTQREPMPLVSLTLTCRREHAPLDVRKLARVAADDPLGILVQGRHLVKPNLRRAQRVWAAAIDGGGLCCCGGMRAWGHTRAWHACAAAEGDMSTLHMRAAGWGVG